MWSRDYVKDQSRDETGIADYIGIISTTSFPFYAIGYAVFASSCLVVLYGYGPLRENIRLHLMQIIVLQEPPLIGRPWRLPLGSSLPSAQHMDFLNTSVELADSVIF